MEKLHFRDFNKHNKIYIPIMFIGFFLMIFGFFEIIDFDNPKINRYIMTLGQAMLTIAFALSFGFFYKNVVRWNRLGMNIRLKMISAGTDIKFSKVDKAELQGDELLVVENGIEKRINLSKIRPEDRKKLLSIILEHIED